MHVVRQVPQQTHAVLDQLDRENIAHVWWERQSCHSHLEPEFYLIVDIFTVNLGLDDVHERVDQPRALSQLPPGLAAL